MTHTRTTSRGLAMIAVLAVLMIVGGFSLTVVRSVTARRQMLLGEERRIQAEWLAEAGLERALAKQRTSGDDKPETWNIPEEELGGRGAGRVTIKWAPSPPDTGRRTLLIEAKYPADIPEHAFVRREFIVNSASTKPGVNQ